MLVAMSLLSPIMSQVGIGAGVRAEPVGKATGRLRFPGTRLAKSFNTINAMNHDSVEGKIYGKYDT